MNHFLRNIAAALGFGIASFVFSPQLAYSQPTLAPETPLPADSPLYVQPKPPNPQEPYVDPFTKIVNANQRSQIFARIWEQRYKRDISAEILPFVDDPDRELSQRALRALGRLENPAVLPELQKRKAEQEAAIIAGETDYDKRPKRYFNFAMPIARIESRDLHGRQKIEFVLAHLEPAWTWDEAVESSKRLKEYLAYIRIPQPDWNFQLERLMETSSMLYLMSKNGEDISELRQAFLFSKPQNVQLDGAKLPLAQEIENLIDHSFEVDIVGNEEEYVYESFLLSLGEPARVAIRKRLEQILRDKPQFTHKTPLTCLLRAAARTGDVSFLPLFARFQTEMSYVPYATADASRATDGLKMGLSYPYAPY